MIVTGGPAPGPTARERGSSLTPPVDLAARLSAWRPPRDAVGMIALGQAGALHLELEALEDEAVARSRLGRYELDPRLAEREE